jgi:hypothetical protein
MSYGNKVDDNHVYLRDTVFRRLAKSVIDCSQFGMGFADLLVLTNDGQLLMVEIKDGAKPPSKRRLTPMQKDCAMRFGVKFLVAKDANTATRICIEPHLRHLHDGRNYILETES